MEGNTQMNRFNERQIKTQLDNGLTVILHHKPGYNSTSALFGTHFGAMTLTQSIDGKRVDYPAGIAHFLEHKLFEPEEMDVLSAFTNMGASANAFTSYQETVCYFSTSQDYQQPLKTLLDFVQGFNTTADKIEKEKGIIAQELLMYQQMPQFQLHMSLYKAMYHQLGLNQDIAGSLSSIEETTLDDVLTAYEANYHPSQMVLSIVSHEPMADVLTFIKENQNQKIFRQAPSVQEILPNEPKEVVEPWVQLEMDVSIPKVAVGFKQDFVIKTEVDVFYHELYFKYLTALVFTGRNPLYQEWLDDNILADNFSVSYDVGLNYGFISFSNETKDAGYFKQFLIDQLEAITINPLDFEAIKRRYLGESISSLEDAEDLMVDNFRAHKLGLDIFEQIDALQSITLDDLNRFIKTLSTEHVSVVVINNKE